MVNNTFARQVLAQLVKDKFSPIQLKRPVADEPGVYAFFAQEPTLGTFTGVRWI